MTTYLQGLAGHLEPDWVDDDDSDSDDHHELCAVNRATGSGRCDCDGED